MGVAVVERLKQEAMYGLSPGTKKVAFIEWWPLWRGGPWWRIDCISLFLTDCVKYWRTNYCLIGILTYWINNWLAYWRRLGFYFTEWMTWLDSTVWLDCMFLLVDFFICCELYGEVFKSLEISCNSISRRENGYKLSAQRFPGSFWWTSVSFYWTIISKPTNNYHELGYKRLRLVFFV